MAEPLQLQRCKSGEWNTRDHAARRTETLIAAISMTMTVCPFHQDGSSATPAAHVCKPYGGGGHAAPPTLA